MFCRYLTYINIIPFFKSNTLSDLLLSFLTLQKFGINSISKYNNLQKNSLDWKGNDSSVTGKALFEKSTYSVEDVVDYIKIGFDNKAKQLKINSTRVKDSILIEHGHRKYGKCFVYQPEKRLRNLGIHYIYIAM